MDEQKNNNEENVSEAEAQTAPTEDIENIKQQRDEYLDGWKRAKADFINYKKEEAKRLEQVTRYGMEGIMHDLLTVLDSFELSIAALEKQEEAVDKGIYMIKGQLEDVLKRRGLERIKAKKGDMFDPQYHEAISSVESEGESGTILEEIEAGYTLYGKVIRASRVRTIQ